MYPYEVQKKPFAMVFLYGSNITEKYFFNIFIKKTNEFRYWSICFHYRKYKMYLYFIGNRYLKMYVFKIRLKLENITNLNYMHPIISDWNKKITPCQVPITLLIISTKETFLFQILKHSFQNFIIFWKTCFMRLMCTIYSSTIFNIKY